MDIIKLKGLCNDENIHVIIYIIINHKQEWYYPNNPQGIFNQFIGVN